MAAVTHEIKSPLNGIMGCSDLLLSGGVNLSSEQQEQVSVIVHSATVLNLLVDNVYVETSFVVWGVECGFFTSEIFAGSHQMESGW